VSLPFPERGREPLRIELEEFLGAARFGWTVPAGGQDALQALRLALEASRQITPAEPVPWPARPRPRVLIASTAVVDPRAEIGEGTQIWHFTQVREGAVIGRGCRIGTGVYIDRDVRIGDHCKIQNGANIYRGVVLEDGVFVGPGAQFTNDPCPRAVAPDGRPLGDGDWEPVPTVVRRGASIGAGATILCGVEIGEWAMVAAGSVVTRSVPPHALAAGVPARVVGAVCACGRRAEGEPPLLVCPACGLAVPSPL
jgi:UDP-2-acetamido-3-amino-2,3-dideoxy-glucuronate N-acetyltransferase